MRAGLWALVALAGVARPGFSQATAPARADCTRTPTDEQCLVERFLRDEIARESQVVYPYALAGAMPTSVKLVAGTDNKTASLTYAIPLSALSSLSLSATAPLSESDARTGIVQLSGLANKGKVGAQWTWGHQRLPTPERANAILTKLRAACTTARQTSNTAPDSGIREEGCDLTTLASDNVEVRKLVREYQRTALYATLKGDVGRETFAFADAVTFTDVKRTKYPAAGSLTFGALWAPVNVFTSLGVRWENGYKDADQQAVCGPPQLGQSQACPLKIVGLPGNERRGVVEAEGRWFLPVKKHPIGLSAILRWDWEQDEESIEVPVYLVQDKDGGLSGGISAGYVWSAKPETKGARFSVFVGQTFGLVPSGK